MDSSKKTISVKAIWVIWLIIFIGLFINFEVVLFIGVPIGGFMGVVSLLLAIMKTPYRAKYVLTGLFSIAPLLLLILYVYALGSAWRN